MEFAAGVNRDDLRSMAMYPSFETACAAGARPGLAAGTGLSGFFVDSELF